MSGTISNALGLCDKFLADARAEKKAALQKAATDPSDSTTQPVMKADDGTVKATTGARAAENDADIRKAYGDLGNSGQEDSSKASSTHPSDSIGTVKMDSSEVKGNVQTPKAVPDKPSKPTGGAESPNHPSNDTFSEKYSEVTNIGKRILTGLASIGVKTAAAPVAPPPAAPAAPAQEKQAEQEKLAAATKYKEDAEAGYMAAEFIAKSLGFSKEASTEQKDTDAAIDAHLENIVKSAHADADLYAEFLSAHIEGVKSAQTKKAEGLGGMMMPASGDGSDGGAAGGTEIPPEALAAAAGGGPEAGGPPPMGPEGAGGPPGGGGGEEAVLDALADALAQAGVTPEELAAAVAEAQAGGAGGGMEGGGGLPPEAMGGAGGPPPEAAPAPAAPAGPPPTSAPKEAGEKKEDKGEKKEDKGEKKEAAAMQKAAAAIKAAVLQSNKNKLMGTIRQLVAK